jgi:hypothetical protein
MTEKCLFCGRNIPLSLTPNTLEECPYCGVIISAAQSLPVAEVYPAGLDLPALDTWDVLITVKENRYLQFYWDPEELLTTTEVAQILDVASPRSVARMVRNGFMPNAVTKTRGTVGIRYLVPRKDVANYLFLREKVAGDRP